MSQIDDAAVDATTHHNQHCGGIFIFGELIRTQLIISKLLPSFYSSYRSEVNQWRIVSWRWIGRILWVKDKRRESWERLPTLSQRAEIYATHLFSTFYICRKIHLECVINLFFFLKKRNDFVSRAVTDRRERKWGNRTLCDITKGAFSVLWVIRLFFNFFFTMWIRRKVESEYWVREVRDAWDRKATSADWLKTASRKWRSAHCAPVEEGFCDLNRPTTLLPWKPPERSNTALVRGCFQQTTGSRLCR